MSSIHIARLRAQTIGSGVLPLPVRAVFSQIQIFLFFGLNVDFQRHRAKDCTVDVVWDGNKIGFFAKQRLKSLNEPGLEILVAGQL